MSGSAQSTYWEDVHAGKDMAGVSWWQDEDAVWVDLVEATGAGRDAHVVDVGSGSSTLPDALIARGYSDLTLVDLSPTALARTRERLRAHVPDLDSRLRTVVADVLELELHHPADVWFDRAVLHFLTEPDDVQVYAATLHAALAPGGCAVVATFAPDGPEQCSGLPVRRYDADGLVQALDATTWAPVLAERRVHRTPWGSEQPFTVVAVRRPAP